MYTQIFAGGGIARGKVVGSSDKHGGDPASAAMSPKDVLATSLHLLGIDPHTHVIDPSGRPMPVCGDGEVRHDLLA